MSTNINTYYVRMSKKKSNLQLNIKENPNNGLQKMKNHFNSHLQDKIYNRKKTSKWLDNFQVIYQI